MTQTGKIQISELEIDEIDTALKLVWEVFSEFEAPEYENAGIAEFKKFIEPDGFSRLVQNGGIKIYGAKIDGQIKGVAATRDLSHICLLFVAKENHRQGIAKNLFNIIEKKAFDAGKNEMTVNSSPFAVEIYKKLGFVPAESEKTLNGIRFTPMKKFRNSVL